MPEHPILFNGWSVGRCLAGAKTQTRRIMKPQPQLIDGKTWVWPSDGPKCLMSWGRDVNPNIEDAVSRHSPFGQPGDLLWGRETWGTVPMRRRGDPAQPTDEIVYRATDDLLPEDHQYVGRWRPPIHMPRWASRLTLEVLDVRAERLQEISEVDVLAEGTQFPVDNAGRPLLAISGRYPPCDYLPVGAIDPSTLKLKDQAAYIRAHFASLWDPIHAKKGFGWEANPWVWAVSFRRLEGEQ